MTQFVLVFRGGVPSTPEEGEKIMEAWGKWAAGLGEALTPGSILGMSRYLTAPGVEEACPGPVSGYSIVEATDMEAALEMAGKNPIFSAGGTIEVAQVVEM